MSSIVWDGDNLIQRLGRSSAELGHVKFDQDPSKVVLWLRDTRNVFAVNGGYVRGDEFASMSEAKKLAAVSSSASLLHHLWLAGLKGSEAAEAKIRQALADAQTGKPLRESTFKEVMAERDRQAKRWAILNLLWSILLAVASALLAG